VIALPPVAAPAPAATSEASSALVWTLPNLTAVRHDGSAQYRQSADAFKKKFCKRALNDYTQAGAGPKDSSLLVLSSFPAGNTDSAVHTLLQEAGFDPSRFYDMFLVEGPRAKAGHYLHGMLLAKPDSQTFSVVLGTLIGEEPLPRRSQHLRLVLRATREKDRYNVEIAIGQNWQSFGTCSSTPWTVLEAGLSAEAIGSFLQQHTHTLAEALKSKLAPKQPPGRAKRAGELGRLEATGVNSDWIQLGEKRRRENESLQSAITDLRQRTGFHERRARRADGASTAAPRRKKTVKTVSETALAGAAGPEGAPVVKNPSELPPGFQNVCNGRLLLDPGGHLRMLSDPLDGT
jgi:hypothetical protein